jgi:hypothetical protein
MHHPSSVATKRKNYSSVQVSQHIFLFPPPTLTGRQKVTTITQIAQFIGSLRITLNS